MSLQTGKNTTVLPRGPAYIRVLILIIDIYIVILRIVSMIVIKKQG